MSKPKRKKKKERPVFRPLSPVTRSKCKRLEEEEIYDGIMTVAENAETPLSPSVIHEHIGGHAVCSFWDVRRCLINMQDNQIMEKTGDDSWILYEKYNVEENEKKVQAEGPINTNDAICIKKLEVTNKLLSFMSRQEVKCIGEIASALGEEQSGISRLLHFLENKNVVSKMPDNKWILGHDFKDIDVSELREEIPNIFENDDQTSVNEDIEVPELQKEIPNIFENEDHTPMNEDCACPNAGDRCHHLHMHCHQHWTINHYVQNGNGNTIITGQHADFHHTSQRHF